ncbi:MAG: methylated-DNA--[protein]-cysteine S-methyltransferase, partial [Thermodesulfobacteriota bacterium]|nr:methylated-DNA--[protein]-cysteine S-methyltransferase [Thermodesulfobacteriota bacterium]
LPLSPQGTPFQLAVWELMQQIPYGETRSYGELAAGLGNPNKARAVGGAANKNPLPMVIPCHRVMGANGKLTGFAGGLATKQFLLSLET